MWEFARQTVLKLEGRLKQEIQFVAAEHNDHTPIRHVHLIALFQGKLNVADLNALMAAATEVALFQRQERDLALSPSRQGKLSRRPFARTVYPAAGRPQASNRGMSLLERLLLDEADEEKAPRFRPSGSKPLSDVTICHLCGKRVGKGYARCY